MTTDTITAPEYRVDSPLGELVIRPRDRHTMGVMSVEPVTIFRVEYERLNGTVHDRPEGWVCGGYNQSQFAPWYGMSLYRPDGPLNNRRGSPRANEAARKVIEEAVTALVNDQPEVLEAAEAHRRSEVASACARLIAKHEAQGLALDQVMRVAITGEPIDVSRDLDARWLKETGALYALGLELWYHRAEPYEHRIVPARSFTPEYSERWERAS